MSDCDETKAGFPKKYRLGGGSGAGKQPSHNLSLLKMVMQFTQPTLLWVIILHAVQPLIAPN